MDKFENEEKFGFYYESDQDSGSDSDWTPSQESVFEESCTSSEESDSSQDSDEYV